MTMFPPTTPLPTFDPTLPLRFPGGPSGQYKPEVPAIFTPQPASPKMPGWGEQLNQFFTGVGRFARDVTPLIQVFKNPNQPLLAGAQMMSQFGMDDTGAKTPEDNVANLENVLKILQQYGVIGSGSKGSEPKSPELTLDVGAGNTRIG